MIVFLTIYFILKTYLKTLEELKGFAYDHNRFESGITSGWYSQSLLSLPSVNVTKLQSGHSLHNLISAPIKTNQNFATLFNRLWLNIFCITAIIENYNLIQFGHATMLINYAKYRMSLILLISSS